MIHDQAKLHTICVILAKSHIKKKDVKFLESMLDLILYNIVLSRLLLNVHVYMCFKVRIWFPILNFYIHISVFKMFNIL